MHLFRLPVLRSLLIAILLCVSLHAQSSSSSVSGTVTDPSGAIIPQADLTLSDGKNPSQFAQTDARGTYKFVNVPPGTYTLTANATGFAGFAQEGIRVDAHPLTLNVALKIDVQQQEVTVSGDTLDSSPDKNGGSIIMKGRDLDALSDNPDGMQTELQAIAGTDPDSGTQFYIDGFSGGKLPPKSSIREIRINQNPYSAQYDAPGWGRVEIFTKPGSDKLHGFFFITGNDSAFNSRNPFVTEQPAYHSTYMEGDVNGPLTKQMSYFLAGERGSNQTQSFVNAIILNQAFQPVTFTQAVSSPSINTQFNPRVDFQWGKTQTISLRYSLNQSKQTSSLASQFSLPTQALNSDNTSQTFQFSDTQTLGESLVNETRFQYVRTRNSQISANHDPTIEVQGAFTGGGNNTGDYRDNQDSYELQDYVSIVHGDHYIKFGARYRANRDANRSTGGFNGQFVFPSITAYQITEQGLANHLSPAEIRAAGGGASQFSITTGNPSIAVLMQDLGAYIEDDWKLRPSMTLSYGTRYETQTGIPDHIDFAPRIAYAWSLGMKKNKPPFAVVRAGIGIFYTRFASNYIANAERQNGITESQSVVNSPDCYPDIATCTAVEQQVSPTIYSIDPLIHTPYVVQDGISLDKNIANHLNLSANYIHARGIDLLLTRNINAPLPGTYNPADPTSGVRPLGGTQNIYQYESEGASKRNRFVANVYVHTKTMGLFGYYMLAFNKANTSGAGNFPSNQYDLHVDYGRASNDIHNRVFFGGYARLPYHFTVNPFLIYQSSSPFNITIGQDINGDAQFNDRPAFATDLTRPSVYRTKWGNFDTNPLPGQTIIPINYGTGPAYFTTNLRIGRTFSFGPVVPDDSPAPPSAAKAKTPAKKKEIEHRYNLFINVAGQNIFNYVNPAQPVGVLTSPLFGKSTALASVFSNSAANRSINLDLGFQF